MLTRIASYTDPIEAHLARGRLEAEGIPAFVCHEHHVWAYWIQSLLLGGVKVYVHPNDTARAREIIAAHDGGEYALPDEEPALVCPRCRHDGGITRGRMSWKAALLTAHVANVPLYFRWATWKCGACGHEWDMPSTRTYPMISIALVGLAAVVLLLVLFVGATCWTGKLTHWTNPPVCRSW